MPSRNVVSIVFACVLAIQDFALEAHAAIPIAIFPQTIELTGPHAIQSISVTRVAVPENTTSKDIAASEASRGGSPETARGGTKTLEQLHVGSSERPAGPLIASSLIELRSVSPKIAKVQGNTVIPVADGKTQIQALVDGQVVASADVLVQGSGEPRDWSFRNDVQSVLARQGCNMGACHGALAGKGGFRLSLRGYDSKADFHAIAREARGRRVEIADPGRSLLLSKPSGALPHKGGLKLDPDSRDYEIIARWIAAGATGPRDDDPVLESISVTPQHSRLAPGDKTRVLVTGHYSDGTRRDVTQWSKFTATDESVTGVDEHGNVSIRGSGEGAVLVWFGSQVQLVHMTVPYRNEVDASAFANAPRRNFIDDLNLAQLQTLRLPPQARCEDEAFLRRVTIDCIGRLPTIDERESFLKDIETRGHLARDQVIDSLLSSEGFVDYWTYRISDILLINGRRLRPLAVKAYYQWVQDAIAHGQPWDEMVRDILTSKGISTENGATNFFALHQSPEEMTENACQAFLGLSIGCAKCHNHPLEKWTNDQYYAMANLFSRVRAKGWGGDARNGDGIRTLYLSRDGELLQPSTGRPQPPAALGESPLSFDDPNDRRIAMADWMTNPDNPYFSRSITNRIWANFFGRGLVESVDDLRLSNPASNDALMKAISQHLVDVGFDLRSLMRTIMQSETYQRSSLPSPENAEDTKYLSRYFPRRMIAEVLLDSIDQSLQTATSFDTIQFDGANVQKTDLYPLGTKSIELSDSAVKSYFLKTFGRNPRDITCDCERSSEPSMVQVLHLSNGDTLNPKLQSASSMMARAVQRGASNEAVVRELFQRALCRNPTTTELAALLEITASYGPDENAVALQDVAWSILTSTEFTFNH